MGVDGHYYDDARWILQYLNMDFGNDREEGRRRGMGVGLRGSDIGGYRGFSYKGVSEDMAGKN